MGGPEDGVPIWVALNALGETYFGYLRGCRVQNPPLKKADSRPRSQHPPVDPPGGRADTRSMAPRPVSETPLLLTAGSAASAARGWQQPVLRCCAAAPMRGPRCPAARRPRRPPARSKERMAPTTRTAWSSNSVGIWGGDGVGMRRGWVAFHWGQCSRCLVATPQAPTFAPRTPATLRGLAQATSAWHTSSTPWSAS